MLGMTSVMVDLYVKKCVSNFL